MGNRLEEVLGCKIKAREWLQTPIPEWHGFTVKDMEDLGYHVRVRDWFDKLSNAAILQIGDYKCLHYS